MSQADYQRQWQQIHGGPGGQRKTWGAPTDVKLSPRGTLDTNSIINRAQQNNARQEYDAQWRKYHQNDPQQETPRTNAMKDAQKLDTDRIIRNVTKEDRVVDDGIRRRRENADMLKIGPPIRKQGGSNPINGGGNDYRQGWEEMKNQQQRANNSSLKDQTDEFKAGTMPGNESDSVKWQKRKERNDEYNAFLASKNPRSRFDDKKPGAGNINSLPRLNYSTSAQKRQREEERNREYNDMLQQKEQGGQRARGGGGRPADVHTGWGTPDYSDILAKQRAKEQNFRRANDIAYETDPVTRQTNPNGPPSVRRSKDQGGEYFASLPLGRNTDSAQQRQKNRYGNELKMQMAEAAQARQIERKEGLLVNNNSVVAPVSSRPIGGGSKGADPYYPYLKNLPDYDELSPRSNAILGRRQPTSERLRNHGLSKTITPRGEKADLGILDMGLFNQPRTTSLDPPAGLVYQPSTFITANSVPQLNSSVDEAYSFYANQNPLDPSLKTEPVPVQGGQRNVPSLNLGGLGVDPSGPGSRVRFQEPRSAAQGMQFTTDDERKQGKKQDVNEYRAELERQMAENNRKKQRAKEDKERYEMRMEEEAKYYDPFGKGGGGAPMRDPHGNVISDLRQMRSDNAQQLSHRDRAPPPRVEIPTFTLDRSPRGGAGSSSYRDDLIGPPPVQTTADGDTSHARGGHGIFGMPKTDVEKMQADKYKLDLKRQMEEKKAEEYRKKEQEKLEEEREQKIFEEQRAKIQREYEEEQRRNNEKKEEARRKNEEMMRAAEDKKKELERQRREEEDRRQEDIRQQRERELQDRQREEEAKRGKSPPLPALRGQGGTQSRQEKEEGEEEDAESRPEPVARSPPIAGARAARTPVVDSRQDHTPYNRAQSADVLNQLTRLRTELKKESDRVQTMLHDQEDDVQIYDPRHIQRPPPAPIVSTKPEVDVFDTALNRNPVVVRRTPNDRASSRAVEDFNALKHKTNTDSRKQFRDLYPGEPMTSDALEAQQAALLQHQEERLQYLKDRRALQDTSGLRVGGPSGGGRDTHSSSSQLVSNSAFVEVNGIGHFPDDFEDIPRRNDSARYRRRSRVPSSPQIERIPSPDFQSRATFGSQTSLNVDKMARKNEDRLRKLRDLQGDDLSLYDPEDVLDRFMSKQGHNRPPSRNTLLDDTWMRAASTNNRY